jgi:hypothetical protein
MSYYNPQEKRCEYNHAVEAPLNPPLIIHNFKTLHEVALVSFPPQKFAWPPQWYYQQHKINNYKGGTASCCMMFTLNFMKTHQMFKKSLGGTDKWI